MTDLSSDQHRASANFFSERGGKGKRGLLVLWFSDSRNDYFLKIKKYGRQIACELSACLLLFYPFIILRRMEADIGY